MILGYSEHSLGFIAAVSIPLRGGVFNQPSQKEEYRPINQQKINTVLNLSTIHHNTPNHITPHYEIKRNNRKRLYINDFFSMTQYKTARHTTVQKISLIICNIFIENYNFTEQCRQKITLPSRQSDLIILYSITGFSLIF